MMIVISRSTGRYKMLKSVPICLPLFFYIKSVNSIDFLLVCILTADLLKFQIAKPKIQSMLCLRLLLAVSFQIDKCMMGLRQLLQMLTCCQHQMMICLVTILKKKISLTCTLYSHVSFVFELAHGCISYVCWPHKVASFFFLHKRNIEPSHRSLCNIVLSGTKQIFKLRRLLCSFSWVHVALKDFLFKGM